MIKWWRGLSKKGKNDLAAATVMVLLLLVSWVGAFVENCL